MTGRRPGPCSRTWRCYVRGDVLQLTTPRDTRGHQQRDNRYAVVVQSDLLPLSTWLVAPTSTSARPASFRPEIEIEGKTTRVLVDRQPPSTPNGSDTSSAPSATSTCRPWTKRCTSS